MKRPCACGKIHIVEADHYDRIILDCGRKFFVLQPKRNGPLELRPWPGPNLTREEYKAKYPGE